MGKIKNLLRNKWVGFTLAALLYTLWFVVWTGNLWLLLGLPVIFDLYITKFFYRYVWSHNVKMCQRSKTYRTVYEWVNAIIFATVVATLVHLFIFQMYVIPTSSMERTLLIGDYLYVSKVAYGPQMPNTPLSFPFVHHTMPFSQTKKSFSEAIKWPYHRLKGLKPIRRNDVVVFNFPAGDTVLLENQNVTYYDTLRSFEESFGKEEGRKRLNEKYTVISRPVDKRENYIKRCVGLPGDSLEVRNGKVWVNGEPQEAIPGLQYNYVVQTSAPFTQYAIDNLGIREYSGYGSVKHLEKNSKADLGELAILLGTDEISVANEIADMEKEGIICGYHTLIDWDKAGRGFVNALIEVRVTPQRERGFDHMADRIVNYPEVTAVYLISGSYDYLVSIDGKTLMEVSRFVSEKLSTLEGVVGTTTHFVLKKYKDHGTILKHEKKEERIPVMP